MPTNVAPTKAQGGKMFTMNCDCGFSVKDHNRAEMVEIGMLHGKMTHPEMKLGKAQIEGIIKSA